MAASRGWVAEAVDVGGRPGGQGVAASRRRVAEAVHVGGRSGCQGVAASRVRVAEAMREEVQARAGRFGGSTCSRDLRDCPSAPYSLSTTS